jgi:hypothetical protein
VGHVPAHYQPSRREVRVLQLVQWVFALTLLPMLVAIYSTKNVVVFLAYVALLALALLGTTAWIARNHDLSFRQAWSAKAQKVVERPNVRR